MHVIDGKLHARELDAAIAELAELQHGVVTRIQLAGLGLGRGAIDHRIKCGRLHLIHRGVFTVGHRLTSREGRWLAAVLTIGPGAALSHQSAAALWGMRATARPRVDVSVPRVHRSRTAIQVHQAVLAHDELTTTHCIPVTTPARTLLDLAAVVGPQALERAINEAEILRLTSPHSLVDLVNRHRGRPGIPAIQPILDVGFVGAIVTRNDVELDGYETHGTRAAFESDRARDRALQVAGWRVCRVTWRQLHERPAAVVSELSVLLRDP
jgi:hypothetical protein